MVEVLFSVRAGPDVRPPTPLPVGRHVVGSGRTATMQLEDPFLEPHHFELIVEGTGMWRIRELTGAISSVTATGIDHDNSAGTAGADDDNSTGVPLIERAEFIAGASRIVLVRSDHARWPSGGLPSGRWWSNPQMKRPDRRIAVVRPLRTLPIDPASELAELASIHEQRKSTEPSSHGGGDGPGVIGLLGPAVGLVVAVSMAVVMRQVLYLAFAMSAVVVSGVTWIGARRRRRRAIQGDRAAQQAIDVRYQTAQARGHSAVALAHEHAIPSVDLQLGLLDQPGLWARRREHGDEMRVVIGEGTFRYRFGEETIDLAEVTVPVDLRQHRAIAVTGPFAEVACNSILAQLALQAGPADWLLVPDEQTRARHRWVDRLPQCTDALAVADDGSDGRHLVTITRGVDQLVTPSTRLRRWLATHPSMTVIAVIDAGLAVPAICDGVFHTGLSALGRWHTVQQAVQYTGERTGDRSESAAGVLDVAVRLAGVSAATIEEISVGLSRHVDPEFEAETALPDRVDLADLLPVTPELVADGWQRSAVVSATMFPAVIGCAESTHDLSEAVPYAVDLVQDGPHALVAGTTGSGKSELLRTLVLSMAVANRPDEVNFVLVDYKGGATFDACERLVHTVGVVTDLDAGLAERALISLEAELRRREHLLRDHGVGDLVEYRKRRALEPQLEPLPRLVVVIDEFAALAKEVPGFIGSLVGVAQRGRSLGIHLILATQRPAGVLDDAIRANTDLRIALRLNDKADAHDVAGSVVPTTFPRSCPGRALIRGGPGDQVIVQSAISTPIIDQVVDAVASAAEVVGFAAPRRPWLPPLSSLSPLEFEMVRRQHFAPSNGADADDADDHIELMVGLIDDPERQRQVPLLWRRRGNLVLIGSPSSAVSSALSIVVRAERRAGSSVSMIDAIGVGWLPDPAVVSVADTDRLLRLLRMVAGEIEQRRESQGAGQHIDRILAIDGLASLRRTLDEVVGGRELLDRVMADAATVGIGVIASLETDGGRSASVLGRFAERWVFAIDDPAEAPLYGVPAARLPPVRSSDLHECVIAGSCHSARLFECAVDDESVDLTPLVSVGVLERSIDLNDVIATAGELPEAPTDRLAIGLDHLDLLPNGPGLELRVRPDESGDQHLLVLGPPRSGRSTTLDTIAAVLPADRVVIRVLCCVDDLIEHHRHLEREPSEPSVYSVWLIDDLESIDDRDRQLESWVERHVPGRIIIAAGRPDVLRDRYGHWSTGLRRSRRGLIMSATPDRDADLLGSAPPRHCPLPARPGLAWIIEPDGSDPRLIQIARVCR